MALSQEKRYFLRALYIPILLQIFIWASKGIEEVFGISFGTYGIYPLHIESIPGIIFSPLIHSDIHHLISNSIPLLLLTTALFYFYRPLAFRVLVLLWIVTGLCVWIGGREAYHIGASGLVYGEASFLFFSGIIRGDAKLASISLLVIFLYGSMIWGIFPIIPEISWESHLFGGFSGLLFAIIYRNEGPQRQVYQEDEDEDENENENENEEESESEGIK
jgi:membrane associated rhomboid family serine protease